MSIRACRIFCTVGHPCSLSHTRGATSLDNSWNVCKHTCRDNRIRSVTRIKSVKNIMDWFVEHAALHVPWQRRNTAVHLWGVLAATQRGITRTIYSAKTDMTLATLCDQQRCLPGTYRLKKKGLKINKYTKVQTCIWNYHFWLAPTSLQILKRQDLKRRHGKSHLLCKYVTITPSESSVPGQYGLWSANSGGFL